MNNTFFTAILLVQSSNLNAIRVTNGSTSDILNLESSKKYLNTRITYLHMGEKAGHALSKFFKIGGHPFSIRKHSSHHIIGTKDLLSLLETLMDLNQKLFHSDNQSYYHKLNDKL